MQAIHNLRAIVDRGMGDFGTWREIFNAFEMRRRLSETERKGIAESARSIPAEKYVWFVSQLPEGIADYVSNPTERYNLLAYVQALLQDPRAGMDPRYVDGRTVRQAAPAAPSDGSGTSPRRLLTSGSE